MHQDVFKTEKKVAKEKQSYIDIKKIDHRQKQMTLDDFLRKA